MEIIEQRKAAEQGYAQAQFDLGHCYFYGWGVAEDKAEAVKWYRKAAEQGHEKAKAALKELEQRGETEKAPEPAAASTLAAKYR